MTVIALPSEAPHERRRRRSNIAATAIRYQLDYIFEREQLRNFTLSDSQGLVIAYAGHIQESNALAAFAPVLAKSTNEKRRQPVLSKLQAFVPDACENTLYVRTFEVDGEELYLCMLLSEPGPKQYAGLFRAITGVRRILDETWTEE